MVPGTGSLTRILHISLYLNKDNTSTTILFQPGLFIKSYGLCSIEDIDPLASKVTVIFLKPVYFNFQTNLSS